MEIKLNSSVIKPQITLNSAKPLSQLQPGRQLNATVVERLAGNNLWRLNLDGQSVRAESTAKLVPGQKLRLETIKSSGIQELRILQAESPRETVRNTLRNSLPIQRSVTELASLLLNSKPAARNNPLALNVAGLAQEILRGLPSKSRLTSPEGLKQAIHDSGIFMEAKLAYLATNPHGVFGTDLKTRMLRLVAALKRQTESRSRPAPKTFQGADNVRLTTERTGDANLASPRPNPATPVEPGDKLVGIENLLRTAEGAVAKIITEQIASLPKSENQQQTWSLELPFLNDEQPGSIGITIRREQSRKQKNAEPTWSVTLELEPPGLGSIQSKINLKGGKINSYFWSNNTGTSNLINSNLDDLRRRFQQAGLSAGELDAFNAEPPTTNRATARDPDDEMLSERV